MIVSVFVGPRVITVFSIHNVRSTFGGFDNWNEFFQWLNASIPADKIYVCYYNENETK